MHIYNDQLPLLRLPRWRQDAVHYQAAMLRTIETDDLNANGCRCRRAAIPDADALLR
jgi:hypothetical protein